MKLQKILIGILLSVFISACNSSSDKIEKDITIGECKKEGTTEGQYNYIGYKYKNSKLFITHYNSPFYCYNKDSISVEVKKEDNLIEIKETQDFSLNGATRCTCLRDLNITVDNIDIDVYQINIYSNTTDNVISFTVDIENKKEDIIYR